MSPPPSQCGPFASLFLPDSGPASLAGHGQGTRGLAWEVWPLSRRSKSVKSNRDAGSCMQLPHSEGLRLARGGDFAFTTLENRILSRRDFSLPYASRKLISDRRGLLWGNTSGNPPFEGC
ncbi:hypothetical protein BCR35DRAFT_129840 [Leucosporidium creatinivorum]|uniref:Uncharacterized protein n=1 Tax=Leucosporidium creatinivorum TaxID=106004 RepID=A0A1Y2EUP8_9BASI|nr:hypothetical protein BCR35DRAFT_129840 [Leucosporidium creatinivorum]